MIFKQWQQVLDGTKTQTRRPVKPHEYHTPYSGDPELVLPIQRVWDIRHKIKWVVGRTYAVQSGRGKKAVGRIRIMKIRRERLQDIKPHEFKLEGMPTGAGAEVLWWSQMWDEIHQFRRPNRWEDNPEVWVLDFERSEG